MSSSQLPLARPPGFFERFFICRSVGSHLSRGFQISANLNKPVDDVLLSNALRALLVKYPLHCLNFFRKLPPTSATLLLREDRDANGNNYEARLVSEIKYADIVHRRQVQAIDGEFFSSLGENVIPIDSDTASWQLSIVEVKLTGKTYLTYELNHVFVDGKSAINFFDDLVRELANAEQKPDLEFVGVLFSSAVDSPEKLPQSSDTVTSLFDFSYWFGFKQIFWHKILPDWFTQWVSNYLVPGPNFKKNPKFDHYPVTQHNECSFRQISLSPQEALAALKFCKQNNFTLTPFISASALKALSETFAPALNVDPSYEVSTIICGRRFYPELKDQTRYGLYVSGDENFVVPHQPLIELSQKLHKELTASIKSRDPFRHLGLLKLVNIWDFLQEKYDNKTIRYTFEISNLGAVNIAHGDWAVEDIVFSQGLGNGHMGLSVVSTPHGGLNIHIASHVSLDEVQNGETIEQFKSALKSKLILQN